MTIQGSWIADNPFTKIAKEFDMLSPECLGELRSAWLPNMTESGLRRLIDLLDQGSPLLIHGCFTRAVPMGCLATQIAWNHPQTAHLTVDAGITWCHQVAGLNPATSRVLREWDTRGIHDLDLRADLKIVFREELDRRQLTAKLEANALPRLGARSSSVTSS